MTTTLWRGARLVTLADVRGWGIVERGALLVDGETIAWAGAEADLPASAQADAEIDLGGALVTPGLVDCHTHLVYAGQRAGEFEQRLEGASYEEIARAGGGIRSTVAATRAAGDATLFDLARQRALALMSEGVTTIEIKSGYGLSAEHEARCLRVARRLGRELPLDVRTTCLSAHALPPEYAGRADEYIDAVCAWLPALHARAWSTPSTASATASASRRADPARLRRGARARPAGQAPRRATERPAQRGARRRIRRAVVRSPRIRRRRRRRGDGGGRHRRRPPARRVLLPARDPPAPGRGVARRRRADRDRHRPQPGIVADALAAADAQHGVHAVPTHARGSACAA